MRGQVTGIVDHDEHAVGAAAEQELAQSFKSVCGIEAESGAVLVEHAEFTLRAGEQGADCRLMLAA
jgi:hypothetical protein